MKKILLISILMASFLFGISNVDAAVCSACHTMHNSQGGVANSFDGSAHPKLLKGSCMGCHEDTTSANTTKNIASGVQVPVISNPNNAPTHPGTAESVSGLTIALAGGNFYWLTTGGGNDARGHNVNLVTNNHTDTLTVPPGGAAGDIGSAGQITCAGTRGCHGDRTVDTHTSPTEGANMTALAGGHHEGGALDGSTVGKSFRFLKGVLGTEDSDWQQTANSTTDHNEYKGVNATGGGAGSMSTFCAQCHGAFHGTSDVLSGSEWIRHPTDLSVIGQGAPYNGIATTGYKIETPVGRATIAAATGAVAAGQDIVMCLSCHRAHASPNDDILRWDYSTMQVGGTGATGTGCFYCHSDKD